MVKTMSVPEKPVPDSNHKFPFAVERLQWCYPYEPSVEISEMVKERFREDKPNERAVLERQVQQLREALAIAQAALAQPAPLDVGTQLGAESIARHALANTKPA